MQERHPFLHTALVIGLSMLISFSAGWFTSKATLPWRDSSESVAPASLGSITRPERTSSGDMSVLWEAIALLREHYYGSLPSDEELTYASVRGVIAATGDQHTAFVDPIHARLLYDDLQGEFEGIGTTVRQEHNELTIVAPIAGSPADRAGLLPGDVVLTVDGTPMRGKTLLDAITLIRGPRGSKVHLLIRRSGESKNLEFTIERDRIAVSSVQARLLLPQGSPPIGYIQLNDFGAQAPTQFRAGLERLRAQGATSLIVDIRNNPGGYLSAAVEISSEFIGDGLILSERDNQAQSEQHNAIPGGVALDLPLVVLVDQGSASASEILAGAIQDHQRGVVLGTTTFGKGSVQLTHDLHDGSNLRVTVAHWFTPQGRAIHKQGISPDIVVERSQDDLRAGRDPQLQHAIHYLTQGK